MVSVAEFLTHLETVQHGQSFGRVGRCDIDKEQA